MRNYILVVDRIKIKASLKREFKVGDPFRVDGKKCTVASVHPEQDPIRVVMELNNV